MAGSGVSFPCLTVQIAAMWVTGILSERYARNVKKEFSVDCQRYVMDQNKDKQKLNDELMDHVSGGFEEAVDENVAGGMIEICRYCGRPIRNGNIMDHDPKCFVVMTR